MQLCACILIKLLNQVSSVSVQSVTWLQDSYRQTLVLKGLDWDDLGKVSDAQKIICKGVANGITIVPPTEFEFLSEWYYIV